MRDHLTGNDHGAAVARTAGHEALSYRTVWLCEKWSEDAIDFARGKLALPSDAEISSAALRTLGVGPEMVEERVGNLLLNEGIQTLLDLLIGAGGTVFNNANARIGVGDSTTAEAATQTDLQAGVNKLYKGMNATYPSRVAQTVSWQADFTSGEANFAWQEWTIDNGAGAGINLNRKVQSFGTKATGTWTLTGSVTLS